MTTLDAIVNSVLYDGYMLYPYRPSSVKTHRRRNMGALCPQAYCAAQRTAVSTMHFECLVQGTAATTIELTAEFLHLIDRRVRAITPPISHWPAQTPITVRDVEVVEVDGHHYCAWQEATEHRLPLQPIWIGELFCSPLTARFDFPAHTDTEPLRNANGEVVAALIREQQSLEGRIRVSCTCLATGVFRLAVTITNTTPMASAITRSAAMASALVSCHGVLRVCDGSFVSLLDPPERLRRAAAACRNVDVWPVLVGEHDDTLLVSPIALDDHPEIAPESGGDLPDEAAISAHAFVPEIQQPACEARS